MKGGGGLRTCKSVKYSCSLFPASQYVSTSTDGGVRHGVYSGQYRAPSSAENSKGDAPSGDKQSKVKKQRHRNANRLCGYEDESDSVYSGTSTKLYSVTRE
jgi:hypothetical protein